MSTAWTKSSPVRAMKARPTAVGVGPTTLGAPRPAASGPSSGSVTRSIAARGDKYGRRVSGARRTARSSRPRMPHFWRARILHICTVQLTHNAIQPKREAEWLVLGMWLTAAHASGAAWTFDRDSTNRSIDSALAIPYPSRWCAMVGLPSTMRRTSSSPGALVCNHHDEGAST